MTQQELAGAAGVDIKTIGNLESRGRWPIARTRARIEKALGWPPGEMERMASESPEPEPAIPKSLLREIANADYLTDEEKVAVIAAIDSTLAKERGEKGSPASQASPERYRPASL